MRLTTFFRALTPFTFLACDAVTAMAYDDNRPLPAPVGPVAAVIAHLNYDDNGGTIDGFLIGTNVLLTFPKPVCGGIGTLGAIGNSVTYSGLAQTFTSGFQVVNVTGFTNGTITYPPSATATKPSAYPLTPGTITNLNYNAEDGSIDGFVFTPTSGPKVFVFIEYPSSTLTPLLTVGASVSVTGTLFPVRACAPTGAIPRVDAASLTIAGKEYPIGNR